MAQSLGELFVKLGFEVDDKKLKAFNDSITETFGNIVKIAGAAGLATGFYELAKGAENNAVALRNLNSELGVNMKFAQEFASIWKTVNPTADVNAGLAITANMARYASAAKQGMGGSEYGLFGGTAADFINPLTGQFDADIATRKMFERLKSGLPQVLATFGGDKTKVSQLLEAITGSPDMMNVLNATDAQIQKAKELRDITNQNIDDTVKAAEAVAQIHTMWDNFFNHIMAKLAPYVSQVYEGTFIDTQNERGRVRKILGWNTATPEEIDAYIAAHPSEYPAASGALGIRSHNPGNLQPGGREAQYGSDAAGLAAMALQLRRYGNRNWDTINSIVDHWAPANAPGNSTATATAYKAVLSKALGIGVDQRLNLNDPFTLERLMAPMIKQEQGNNPYSAEQIAAAAGDTNNNVTINVQHDGDNIDLAKKIHQRFIDVTYPTVNLGGY